MRPPFRASDVRDRGMGLVEVVIAVILLGILSTAVLAIVLQAQEKTVGNRSRVAASNLAAREVDLVREQFGATDDGPLAVAAAGVVVNPHSFGASGSALIVDGQEYTVKRSASWNIAGVGASACEGGSIVKHPTLSVRVEVTWADMGSIKPVTTTAQLAPPKGTGMGETTAFVAVKVTDAKGQPNPGRRVVVFASSGGESRSNVTDESGCAVVEVNPAAAGTDYTAKVSDAGYVDLAGNPEPARVVGRVQQGELNSSVDIAYDRAASLEILATGSGIQDSDVVGSVVTLYKGGEYAGASPETPHTMPGRRLVVQNLWPGDYAAFFGATMPAGLEFVSVMPGASARIEVRMLMADFRMSGIPASGDLIAVPGTGGSCTDSRARRVSATNGEVMVGSWSFFALTDDYGCVTGPQDLTLTAGDNGELSWGVTGLRVTGVPVTYGTKVWAVPVDAANQACRSPRGAYKAIALGNGATARAEIPAGDWYVFVTDADIDDVDAGDRCASAGLVAVPHGEETAFGWPASVPGRDGRE